MHMFISFNHYKKKGHKARHSDQIRNNVCKEEQRIGRAK